MSKRTNAKVQSQWHICFAAIIFSMLSVICHAQSKPPISKSSENALIRGAELNWQTGNFQRAFTLFKRAANANPENRYTNFRVGEIYFLSDSAKIKSLPYLINAIKYHPSGVTDTLSLAYYYLAYDYMLKEQYDSAIYCFKQYQSNLDNSKENANAFTEISRELQMCNMAPDILKRPADSASYLIMGQLQPIEVDNMGDSINSKYPEYAQVLFNSDSSISFTSRRPSRKDRRVEDNTGKYLEDMYVSNKSNGIWSTPVLYTHQVHLRTKQLYTATVGVSADQKVLFSYRDGTILESRKVGTEWSEPEKISKFIKKLQDEYVPSIFLTNDGKYLYLVTDMKGGYGNKDIYVCTIDSMGNWSAPQNLGATINTSEDEDAPFLTPDGKTLFFSSKGHGGLGGYDIFVSHFVDGKWSTPQNLGAPINSPGDDIYFTYDNNRGYFSSSRLGGYGDMDIYAYYIGSAIPVVIAATDTINAKNLVAGQTINVQDTIRSMDSIESPIYLREGKNLLKLPSCRVYFDLAKSNLKKKYYPQLDSVIAFLKQNKTYKIDVSGYTCSIGAEHYNKELSLLRASSVAKYFYKHGIQFDRVIYRGFGKTDFVAPNDGVHNYLNRRVEVQFIK